MVNPSVGGKGGKTKIGGNECWVTCRFLIDARINFMFSASAIDASEKCETLDGMHRVIDVLADWKEIRQIL